jgi:hypothetical protein
MYFMHGAGLVPREKAQQQPTSGNMQQEQSFATEKASSIARALAIVPGSLEQAHEIPDTR